MQKESKEIKSTISLNVFSPILPKADAEKNPVEAKHTASREAIAALLASLDCFHPERPLTDKTEENYLTQLSEALAKGELNDAAYTQLLIRLEANSLSLAALYRFANLCYQHWQRQWPTVGHLQSQQIEVERQTARLQTLAQGRTLFRRAGAPTRYYWGQTNSTTAGAVEKGQFYGCYPHFEAGQTGQGDGIKVIYQAEAITDAVSIAACEVYIQAKRSQQLTDRLFQQSTVLHKKLQHCDNHAKVIVNLQFAWLYCRSGPVMRSVSIHEGGQAVFYFRQAMGEIARHRFTQQQPPLPAAWITAAEHLREFIDQTLIEQSQQSLRVFREQAEQAMFSAQSVVLLTNWSLCYQEPALEVIYQLSQQTAVLLASTASVSPVAKQPLIAAWLAGFNRGLVGEDDQEVRVAMQSAVVRACNPVQKYPYSLATVHQWLLRIAQELQRYGETGRANALLHDYQQLLISKRVNLQGTVDSTTDQDKTPYIATLAMCKQALIELDQSLTTSNSIVESKTAAPQRTIFASAFAARNEQLQAWHQTLAQSLAANAKVGDVYTANTEFARSLLADICREIEQQIGQAPCAYTLLGAGSFSRGEISPASDLDCALLVAEDAAKTHPWFHCFLQLLQWKLASLPEGILSLESETLAWINKDCWFDTPAGLIEQHFTSQQPNNRKSYQQPENFGAQWFRWIYSSGNQSQEKDGLFCNYQQRIQRFFHTTIGTGSLPAHRQLAPWSLAQHVGQAITPTPRVLSLTLLSAPTAPSSVPTDSSLEEAKEIKESQHAVKASSNQASAMNTFTILNVKNLSYRLINAILCYGRFNDVPPGMTTTRDVLAYLKDHQCLPSAFIARLETALDQLYTWRLRQHWSWLHHAKLSENEVILWPEDAAQQAELQALPLEWRGFYLDKAETQQYLMIVTTVAEVIGRSVEGFRNYAAQLPMPATDPSVSHSENSTTSSSSYTTTTVSNVKETREAKREVSEEEAQAILTSQSGAVAEAKAPTPSPAAQTFNPLPAAVEWTLQQLAKPKDAKTTLEDDNTLRAAHAKWLAQVMGNHVEELPISEPHSSDPMRVKQDSLFCKHWQVYWAIPTAWRVLYMEQLRQSPAVKRDTIIEPLLNAPNKVGWRLVTQLHEQQWQQTLRSLFAAEPRASLPLEAKAEIAQGKAVWVSWVDQETIRWAPLRQEYAERLVDTKAQQWKPKHNSSGNHRLYQLQTPQEHFWLKLYPEQPGTEYLVTALDRRLGIKGTPPQQLLALHHAPLRVPDGRPQGLRMEQSAALLVPHIADSKQNLHRISKQYPQQLDQLDFTSFAKTLLRVLLTNPEDDKGGDYFLLRSPGSQTNRYQLIRIDNERAFLPVTHITAGKRSQEELQVKSILYCLDQMLLPWDSDPQTTALLDDLHQLQPSVLILDLLQDIERQQRCWQQLFPQTVVEQHACLQDPWMSLPVFLLPQGLESALLKRITSLQTALRLLDPSTITGLKLLELVQPKLAQYYNDKLFQGKLARDPQQPQTNVWARFDQVAGRYYRQSALKSASNTADNQISMQSGPAVYSRQLSLALPELPTTTGERSALIAFAHSVWSQQAHSIKQALQGAQQWQHLQAVQIGKGLLALRPEAQTQFGWLPAREQQQILNQLLSIHAAPLTPQQQQFLLNALAGAQCHNLDFRPFKAILTNKLLLLILQEANKQIIQLNLSGCTQLTSDILKDIEHYCPHLKRLQINGQTNWQSIYTGNFVELVTLECNQTIALTDIRFGQLPKLKNLSLADATKLEILGDRGRGITATTQAWPLPQLQQLDTRNCPLLQAVHIKVGKPQTLNWQSEGCEALKVPSIYFSWIQRPAALVDELAQMLKAKSLLAPLSLHLNNGRAKGLQALAEALKAKPPLANLDLSRNNIGTAGAQALTEALKAKPPLVALHLKSNHIGAAGAQALAEALKAKPPLAELDLSENNIGAAGAQALAEALKAKPPLVALCLESNHIGTAGAQALAEALKAKPPLAELDLSRNNIGVDGVQALAEALMTKPPLSSLNLEWNNIDAAGAQALAEALKAKPPLAVLNLKLNYIGDTGAKVLAEALKTRPPLTSLSLQGNHIGAVGAQALADALVHNSTLTDLSIENNDSIPAVIRGTISRYLARNRGLVAQLLIAITTLQYNRAKALLEQGVSVNQVITGEIASKHQDLTPLMVAVQTGDSAIVAIVLAQTFNHFLWNKKSKHSNQTVLQTAIRLHWQTPAKAAVFEAIIRQLIDAYAKHGFVLPIYDTVWLAKFGHSHAESKHASISALPLSSASSSSSTTTFPSFSSHATETSDSEDEALADDKLARTAISSFTSNAVFFQPAPKDPQIQARLNVVLALIDAIYPADDVDHADTRASYLGKLLPFQQRAELTPEDIGMLEKIEKELQAEQVGLSSSLQPVS